MDDFNEIIIEPLTERQEEIMQLVSKGYSNSYIAKKLYIVVEAVRAHLIRIYDKYLLTNKNCYDRRARAILIYNANRKKKIISELEQFSEDFQKDLGSCEKVLKDYKKNLENILYMEQSST